MSRAADSQANLDFISRQIGRLIEREGLDFQTALARIASSASPGQQDSIGSLQALAAGAPLPHDRSTATLGRLLQAVQELGGRIESAVVSFIKNATVGHDAVTDVVRALRASVAYAAMLLLMLCVIGAVMEVFVLPSLSALYGGFGEQLPALTRVLLARSSPLMLIALMGLLLSAAIAWFTWRFGRATRQLTPLPRVLRSLPVVGKVTRSFDALLQLHYTATLLAGGVLPQLARERAESLLDPLRGRPLPSSLSGYLDTAQRLELLPDEVQSQLTLQARELAESADRFGRNLDLVLRLAVYLAIAAFVIAMYLPIFSLGSVV